MTDTMADVRRHSADYGFDGDYRVVAAAGQATIAGGAAAALIALAARSLANGRPVAAGLAGTGAASILATTALFIHTTRVGKFEVWAQILDDLALRGDETLLDLGCGRGAVLLAAAKLLPNGRAIGVDISRADQTGNSPQNTLTNAAMEGVADRVEARTADITDLPYDDDSVDVIVSSLAVHSIPDEADRLKAVSEAARVLRPGRLALADLMFVRQYARRLHELGWTDVTARPLGGACGGGPVWAPAFWSRPSRLRDAPGVQR
jgi:arsenite methyltransferase